MRDVVIKRIYDPAEATDGYRVLVDRLWPRGISRERARLDAWLREIAPSPGLRAWWDHDPARLDEFSRKYRGELEANPAVGELEAALTEHPLVTLLYAARDSRVNHAAVLRDYMLTRRA